MTSPTSRPRGLYLITPDDGDTAHLLQRVATLLPSGPTWLQYRNKAADDALRYEQAAALQSLCAAHGVPLIINRDPQLARAVGAAGVHLAGSDDIAGARALLGADAIIGVSCQDQAAQATRAVQAGASYVAFGAFFPTTTKITHSRAQPDVLRQTAALGVPRVAVGGLTPDNAGPVIAAGADLVAVVSSVFAAADPLAAQQAYLSHFR